MKNKPQINYQDYKKAIQDLNSLVDTGISKENKTLLIKETEELITNLQEMKNKEPKIVNS